MRTTSSLESLNSQLSRTFPTHGHIWQFIEQLKFHEFSKSQEMAKVSKTNILDEQPKTKKARERNERIKLFSNLLNEQKISRFEFLEAMAGGKKHI